MSEVEKPEALSVPWWKRTKEQRDEIYWYNKKLEWAAKEQAGVPVVAAEPPKPVPPRIKTVKFEGVTLSGEGVKYRGQQVGWPATARVETAGEIQSRVTATRLVMTGVFAFAFKKKKDARELYLTVEGEGGAFVVDLNPKKGLEARKFAAEVNSASSKM